MEALLQRCLFYTTVDCRIAYDYIKASLLDPKVKKLVLLAHSQGGIMTSLIVDELTSDLPHDLISKLVRCIWMMLATGPLTWHRKSTPLDRPRRTFPIRLRVWLSSPSLFPGLVLVRIPGGNIRFAISSTMSTNTILCHAGKTTRIKIPRPHPFSHVPTIPQAFAPFHPLLTDKSQGRPLQHLRLPLKPLYVAPLHQISLLLKASTPSSH